MPTPIPGYAGKIAFIDLDEGKTWIEETPWNIVKQVIGGKGLGAYFLYKLLPPQIPSLDPRNVFIIATGPAQGTITIAGRYTIVTKAPHTGLYMDSHVGGFLGPELKFAGYDALVVTGASKSPVWVEISDNDILLHSATDLWGLDTYQTEAKLHKIHDYKSKVISIGPAGENLVSIACTTSDLFRNAARGGIGSLFGSKKLKAISIRGTLKVPITNQERVKEVRKNLNSRAMTNRKKKHPLYKIGTSWLVTSASPNDMLPVLNYQRGESKEAIDGYQIDEKFHNEIKSRPCYQCTIACSFIIDGSFKWAEGFIQHPEYESLALLGSNLGIVDIETLLHLNHLCNLYGLDTISTGSTISWFMESGEREVVPEQYKSEIINFGDNEGALKLVRKIALRDGVGNVLAGGVRHAAELFGEDSYKWAVHVKGLELPAWDPRGKLGLGISYAVTPVGGSHLRGWPSTNDVPDKSAVSMIESIVEQQDLKILKDSLIMCHFTHSISPALSIEDTANIFQGITGIPSSKEDMRSKAHNIWLLTRIINEREFGVQPPSNYDILPYRLMKESLPSGKAKGRTAFFTEEDFYKSRAKLYDMRQLSETGTVIESARSRVLDALSLK